ncbi:hypothetical protein TSUD_69440 [Trifolium subterraneum]|uniref:Uncharacterized protein n=1 Tax=Trifolium subterraneum TaxID=3900 RepID=A0A2Z6MWV7_TRISU|nr:hypothetical protein TSUD_69440 [Trifolium subterraneum]
MATSTPTNPMYYQSQHRQLHPPPYDLHAIQDETIPSKTDINIEEEDADKLIVFCYENVDAHHLFDEFTEREILC